MPIEKALNFDEADFSTLSKHESPVGGMQTDRWWLNALTILTDILLLLACFAAAGKLYQGMWFDSRTMTQALLMTGLFAACASLNSSWSYEALLRWPTAIGRMAAAVVVSAAMLNLLAFFLKSNAQFSRMTFAIALTGAIVSMAATRIAIARKAKADFGPTLLSTLVIDAGGPAVPMGEGQRIHSARIGDVASLNDPATMDRLATAAARFERLVVSCPAKDYAGWAVALKSLGVRAEIIDERLAELGAIEIGKYGTTNTSTLVVDPGPLGRRARFIKRAFDLAMASLILIPALPVMAIIAIAIRLDDGGSILFRQTRLGQANKPFTIFKFRTMAPIARFARDVGPPGVMQVTKLGRFLRRTSLDELPQLLNVLRGEMSLVGPRPHTADSLAGEKLFWEVDNRYWARHRLKPGMTGLAQIRGLRGATYAENDLVDRLNADLQFTSGWSLARDLAILFATVRVVIHKRAF